MLWLIVAISVCLMALPMLTVSAASTLPKPRVLKGGLKIGYLWVGPVADSCKRHFHQAEIECAHRGWKLIPAAELNAAGQRENLQTMITNNVDAIVITYQQMQALEDLITVARNKGIGVYCSDTELRPGVLVDVTSGQGVAAAKMAYWGMNRLNYKGKVAILTYSVEQAERERRDVIRALLNNLPGMEVVVQQDMTTADESKANEYASQWITKYGKDLKWICCIADIFAIATSRAVQAAGLTKNDCFVTGIDGGNTAYAVMAEKGSTFVATSSQPFEWYTHGVFEVINEVQVKGIMPAEKGSSVPPSLMILGDQVLTTDQNMPKKGVSIHSAFEGLYYNPSDKKAWYNWTDAGGPYKVDY